MTSVSRPTCPICRGNGTIFVGKPEISKDAAPFVRADYQIAECESCEFYFVYPEIDLSQKEWGKLYGEGYFAQNPPWWDKKRAEHRRKRLGFLEKHVHGKISRFLDIGCGEGYVLADARKKGWEVVGLDIYDNRLEIARADSISFVTGNIFQAAFPDNYFDCVYMDSVLEHLIDPVSHLNEINRILREGGVMYIGIPNEDSLFNDARRLIFTMLGKAKISVKTKPFKTPFHVVGFTEKSIRKIIDANNFDIARFSIFAGEYEWRKFKILTRGFFVNLTLLPVYLAAIPFRKQIYMDAIARKRKKI